MNMTTPRPGFRKFFTDWVPIVVYGAAIFFQSSRALPVSLPHVAYLDKLLHLLGYALMGALFVRAYRRTRIGGNTARVVFFSILCSSLYGFSDELHQYFVPARSASVFDALADVVGSALGAFAAVHAVRRFETGSRPAARRLSKKNGLNDRP